MHALQGLRQRYISGRGNDWVKKTCAQRETLPIAGFALKENRFDGLYIGRIKMAAFCKSKPPEYA